jgi:hypothetical protein
VGSTRDHGETQPCSFYLSKKGRGKKSKIDANQEHSPQEHVGNNDESSIKVIIGDSSLEIDIGSISTFESSFQ